MGLIQKLKSALGLDGAQSPDPGTATPRDVDVTVEREPSSESEDAVKGTETAADQTAATDEPDVEEASTDESDVAGGSTDESTQEELPIEEAEPSVDDGTEPSVADEDEPTVADEEEPSVDDESEPTEAEEVEAPATDDESADESDDDSAAEPADEATDVPADPVTEISGIGPAYGERLADAGVETVADLAAADPDELEDETDISASRIAGWIDAAAEY